MGQTHFKKLFVELCFLKKCCGVTLLYMIIYESASCLILHMGKCLNIWHGKEKHIWIHGFMVLFGNTKDVLFLFVLFGKLIENIVDNKWFWTIWELCEMLGYYKVWWNYSEMNYEFQFHLAMSFMLFLSLCLDRCDYPSQMPQSFWHWYLRILSLWWFDVFVA